MSKVLKSIKSVFLLVLLQSIIACASYSLKEDKAQLISLPEPSAGSASMASGDINNYAPIIKIYDAGLDFNKVGTAAANETGEVWIDYQNSTFYTHEDSFMAGDNQYRNLYYRIHFSEIPFSIVPFHLSTGKNVGLLFVVTLNKKDQPILFTLVHTCGCYKAMIPTTYTPKSFYPDKWNDERMNVYGETLAPVLNLDESRSKVCVGIRPGVHRVMEVSACSRELEETGGKTIDVANHAAMIDLRKIPSGDGSVSFFHEDGRMEGFVKGAVKPWETLLMSWMSLDFFVGTDKAYIRPETSENTFYTSLKPWQRQTSDMADFARFLNYWGWHLENPPE